MVNGSHDSRHSGLEESAVFLDPSQGHLNVIIFFVAVLNSVLLFKKKALFVLSFYLWILSYGGEV